jgi:Fe-S-cluster containining protein
MRVDCEGCAGCCVDWHALAPDLLDDPEHAGDRRPLDDATNFVPLERDEVRALLEAGHGAALRPRLWTLPDCEENDVGEDPAATGANADTDIDREDPTAPVEIDGYRLAGVNGRPVFYVGLRKPPKPVAPAGHDEPTWLPTCTFLDPETLQCRIHDSDLYPNACAAYPGFNLLLEQTTECERVERSGGGERLLDDEPPADPPGVGLGPQALGAKLFAHPEPDSLEGTIERLASGAATTADRRTFVTVAAASSPGTLAVSGDWRERAREEFDAGESWVSGAIEEWEELAGGDADSGLGERVETDRGAPDTPGWD